MNKFTRGYNSLKKKDDWWQKQNKALDIIIFILLVISGLFLYYLFGT